MKYVNIETNEICSLQEVRRLHSNMSIPQNIDLTVLGYKLLIETPRPTALPWHTISEGAIVDFTQTWEQVPQSIESIEQKFIRAIQHHLDTTAKKRGYDSILSACSYATSSNPVFAAEGQACVEWRDAVWGYCYQLLADVKADVTPMPETTDELISNLPVIKW